ncbi:MAG: serine/threonine protein kinase [Myxococcales bacterium]|nr:serine/threonine protein kinase [Myxococcales bacterium]
MEGDELCEACVSFEPDSQTFAVMQKSGMVLDGRYELQQFLGQGGMGQVWRALDRRAGREVAVKLLSRQSRNLAPADVQLAAEYKAMAMVEHEHIVQVYDYARAQIPDIQGGGFVETGYYTMALVPPPRVTVEHLIRRRVLSPLLGIGLARGIAKALEALAEHRIVHGDIKPANVFVVAAGEHEAAQSHALLSDLSACRLPDDSQRTVLAAGTPSYMAPELLDDVTGRAPGRVSCAADVWAFGALLFEMLTGTMLLPPAGSTPAEVVAGIRGRMTRRHIEERVATVKQSARLRALLEVCLQPQAEARAPASVVASELSPT